MTTQAISAYDASLAHGASAIPELTSIGSVGLTTSLVDTTALDGDGYQSQIPTLQSGGTIPCIGNYVAGDSVQNGLRTACIGKTSEAFTYTLPGGVVTWTFNAFVANWKLQPATPTSALMFTFDLVVDGALDFT